MAATISKLTRSSAAYHCADREESYPALGDMPSSFWFGDAAEALGLSGSVKESQFRSLLNGFDPDGERPMVQNAGERDRQGGTEITFSVPGTLAALFASSNIDKKTLIANHIREAVIMTLCIISTMLSITRRDSKGERLEGVAGLAIACFFDLDNREHQAMPHIHCCILNLSLREDGTYGSLLSHPWYLTQKLIGQIFHELLAQRLEQEMGLELRRVESHFELLGVPSTVFPLLVGARRKQVLEAVKSANQTDAKACEHAARVTRKRKTRVPHRELFKSWEALGKAVGFTEREAEELYNQNLRDAGTLVPSKPTAESIKKDQGILATALGLSFDPNAQRKQADNSSASSKPETNKNSDNAHRGEVEPTHDVPYSSVQKVLARKEWQNLSNEQRQAVITLTSLSGTQVILEAPTGAGKDRVIAAASAIWKKAGYQVIGTTNNSRNSQSLAQNTGLKTKPLGRILKELDRTPAGAFCHHLWQISRALLKKPTWSLPTTIIGNKSVLVLNDAYLISQRRISKIVSQCQMSDTKLVIVSDPVLREALGKGTSIHELVQDASVKATLARNQRQQNAIERQAMESLGRGDCKSALDHLNRGGSLVCSSEPMKSALGAWKIKGIKDPKQHVMISENRKQANELNQLAQALRKSGWQLGLRFLWVDPLNVWERSPKLSHRIGRVLHDELGMTRFRPETHQKIYEGDRIVCTADYSLKGIRVGMTGTIKRIELGRYPQLTICFDNGKSVKVYRASYDRFQLAYAIAAEDMRGRTVENAYVALTSKSLWANYLQLSRGRNSNHVFAPPETGKTNKKATQESRPTRSRSR